MIIYASRTGNVQSIVNKLEIESVKIHPELVADSPFILFTYTDKLGEIPKVVEDFMVNNHFYCKGVIASGNTNFGDNLFCKSANHISERYNVPILHKVELRGFKKDLEIIKEQYSLIMKG